MLFAAFLKTESCLPAQETLPAVKQPAMTARSMHLVSAPVVELDLADHFEVPGVNGEIAQFVTSSGAFNVELLGAAAPNHGDNFRAYVEAAAYDQTMFHRVAAFEGGAGPSILQGGGFSATIPVNPVPARPPVALEYALPNARGTLAAARTGDPNSATSQWFINTRDNSTILGPANDGHGYTVFGRVLGTGMSVVDALAAHPPYNAGGVFASLPLRDIAPGQTQIMPANFLAVHSVRMIPVYPESDSATSLLRFDASYGDSASANAVTAEIIAGRTLRLTALNPGTTSIRITATDTNGNAAEITLPLEVSGRHQTVSFQGDYPTTLLWSPTPIVGLLSAASSVGLPVEFVVESGPATIAGDLLTFTGIGTVVVSARQPGDSDTTPAPPARLTFTVEKGYQSADFGDLPRQLPIDAAPFVVNATASSGLPVTLSVTGPATLGEDGKTVTLTGEAGTVRITPVQDGNEFFHPMSADHAHSIVISRLPQVVGFPALADRPIDPGLNPIPLAAVSDSGLPITYTIDSGPAVLTEDGGALIVIGAGTVTVSARQAGTAVFAPAVATMHFSVAKLPQQIVFPEIADRIFHTREPEANSLALEAEAGSGLPVRFTLVSGAGTITGGTLSLTRQDRFTVRASQPGNAFHEPAEDVERSFVARSDARIVFDAAYENSNYTPVAGVPAVIAPGSRRPFVVRAGFDDESSPGPEVDLLTDNAYLTPYYDFSGLSVIGTPIGTPQNNPARVTPTGATGPITLRAYRAFDADLFLEPSATFTVHVGRTQTIRFDQPKPMPLAQGGITARPTASSKLPVSVEVVSGPATVTPNAGGGFQVNATDSGIVVLRATQPGGGAFAPATPVVREWIVQGEAQTLAFDLPAAATYGDAPISLVASSNLATEQHLRPITFSVASGPGAITASGDKLRLTGAGVVVVRATQAGGAGVGPAFATRTIRVGKAVLQVRGVSAHRLAGAASFDLAVAYTGFVGDDGGHQLDIPPRARTTATKASPPGVYPIRVVGGLDDSYEFAVAGPDAALTLHGFGGSYEALVRDDAGALIGKVALTLSSRAPTYTGSLHLAPTRWGVQPALPALNLALTLDASVPEQASVSGAAVFRSEPSYFAYDRVTFTIGKDGSFTGVLKRKIDDWSDTVQANAFTGRRLYAGTAAPWQGAYTALFLNRTGTDFTRVPLGAGWATVAIDKRGRMKLAGRLADDTPLTASLVVDDLGVCRLLHNPYGKRRHSHLGGGFTLAPIDTPAQTGRYHVPLAQDAVFTWRKDSLTPSGKPDPLYPAGIAPFDVELTLSPWAAPVSKGPAVSRVTLAQRLGLAESNGVAVEIAVSHGEGDFGAKASGLPSEAELTANNAFLPPSPNATNWSLRLADPKTGRFEGSFTLEDPIPAATATNPAATRPHKRLVKFGGVLLQPAHVDHEDEAEGADSLGAGYLVLPPLPGAMIGTGETATPAKTESHEIRLIPSP